MNPLDRTPLASILVPCWNQRGFTDLCVRALFRYTRPAWELIVVDNGSTDDTAAYLAGVRDAARLPITIIRNPQNVGFPRAINQGLQAARGEYLVLLNNDAVVTDGWLDQLIALTAVRVGSRDGASRGPDRGSEPSVAREPAPNGQKETCGRPDGGVGRPAPSAAGPALGKIGLVGPMSNYATPPQLVEEVPYRDLDEMQAFARRWREEHRGKWFTVPKLSGFCLMMTRAVYDSIGGLDERFGLGLFDDDDLAERARRAGFALAIAHDLFIHHFGSRTFAGNGIDAAALLEENARRFAAKWGPEAPRGRRVTLPAWSSSPLVGDGWGGEDLNPPPSGLLPPSPTRGEGSARPFGPPSPTNGEGKPRITLTMIVRDEQENLPNCLESVRGIFDEIVVVDTGGRDRTKEIAQDYGARVFNFAWIDDFAAARNQALTQATGDYAFWLEADDVVDPPEREKLRSLLAGLAWPVRSGEGEPPREPNAGGARPPGAPPAPADVAAYVVRCACDPGPDGSGGDTVVDHVRLFPVREDIRWSYRVHEQIMPALRRAGVPVRWTDVIVRHTGYVDSALRARKLDRDWRILQDELKDRPEEPFLLFDLGAIAIERRHWSGALEYLRKSMARSAPSDSITRTLFALIARSHQMLGETAAALRICVEGLALDEHDAELWFRKGVVHRQRGESVEAETCWRRILGLRRPEQFASLDMGIYGHLTRRNLAALAAERGDHDEVARLWREVLAECPGDREALLRLKRLRPS